MSGILLVVILGIIILVPLLLGRGAVWFQNHSRSPGGNGLPSWRRLAKDRELSSRLLAALLVANMAGFLMLGVFLLFLQGDAGIRKESSTQVAELERRLTRIETLGPRIFPPVVPEGAEKGGTPPEEILTALSALAGLALGGVVLFRAKTTGAALGGALLASVGLLRISDPTLLSFGSLLSFDHLLKIEARSPEGRVHSHGGPKISLKRIGAIGPFASGKDSLESPPLERNKEIQDVLQEFRSPRPGQSLGYILLVGSADKRSFTASSNRELAKRRAEKVRKVLGEKLSLENLLDEEDGRNRFLVDVAGPVNVGPRTTSSELAEDRTVTVWVAWITEEPASPEAPRSASSDQKLLGYKGGNGEGRGGGI